MRAVFTVGAERSGRACFRALASSLLLLALSWAQSSAQPIEPKTQTDVQREESQELERLNRRLAENQKYLSGTMWTLTHAYEDKKAVDELMQLLLGFFTAVEKKDEDALKKIGGVKGFKQKLAAFLDHKDGTVSGSAAMFLGILGDERDAATIAALLKEAPRAKLKSEDERSPSIARGRAAIALGILKAREHIPELMKLMRSDNAYDRAGAVSALALMNAGSEVKQIAALLEAENISDDVRSGMVRISAIDALVTFGAKEYVPHIVKAMFAESDFEVTEAAIYGIVKLGGRAYAGEIAKLLDDSVSKDHAAIALALVGAGEYAKKIAQLLSDGEPGNREAAMLALGILNAKEYAPLIARHLRTDKSWRRDSAALALVLMGARQYRSQIIATLGKSELGLKANVHLPPRFEEEGEQLRKRLETSYKLLRENR
jgi:HEAT repeat protein